MSHPGLLSFTSGKGRNMRNHYQHWWKPDITVFILKLHLHGSGSGSFLPGGCVGVKTHFTYVLQRRDKQHTFKFSSSIRRGHLDFWLRRSIRDRRYKAVIEHRRFFYLNIHTRFLLNSPETLHIKMSLKCHRGNGAIFFSYASNVWRKKTQLSSSSGCSLSSWRNRDFNPAASDDVQCLNFNCSKSELD